MTRIHYPGNNQVLDDDGLSRLNVRFSTDYGAYYRVLLRDWKNIVMYNSGTLYNANNTHVINDLPVDFVGYVILQVFGIDNSIEEHRIKVRSSHIKNRFGKKKFIFPKIGNQIVLRATLPAGTKIPGYKLLPYYAFPEEYGEETHYQGFTPSLNNVYVMAGSNYNTVYNPQEIVGYGKENLFDGQDGSIWSFPSEEVANMPNKSALTILLGERKNIYKIGINFTLVNNPNPDLSNNYLKVNTDLFMRNNLSIPIVSSPLDWHSVDSFNLSTRKYEQFLYTEKLYKQAYAVRLAFNNEGSEVIPAIRELRIFTY